MAWTNFCWVTVGLDPISFLTNYPVPLHNRTWSLDVGRCTAWWFSGDEKSCEWDLCFVSFFGERRQIRRFGPRWLCLTGVSAGVKPFDRGLASDYDWGGFWLGWWWGEVDGRGRWPGRGLYLDQLYSVETTGSADGRGLGRQLGFAALTNLDPSWWL